MSKRKKVLILTAMDPYKDIRALKMADSLIKAKYDIEIIGGFADNLFKKETHYSVIDYKIPYDIKAKPFKKLLWKLNFFYSTFRKIKLIKPDIIHACNIDMLVLAYFYGFKKSKIIYDSYEICAHKSGVSGESRLFSKAIEIIERYLLKRISYMICVSNSAKKYFIEKYNIQNIDTITNVPKAEQNIEFKYSKQHKVVLYIGNFSPNRGIEELILSGNNIDATQTRICLQGFGPYKEDFNKIIDENNLSNVVKFIPPILPETVIRNISQNADIGVVLTKPTSINHQLTVSNKIFDYINAGLPVIMSNVDEHIYINKKYKIGIIIEEVNPNNISDAIKKLSSDKVFYNTLSRNCLNAAKELNWFNEEIKLINIYSNI